MMLIYPGSLDVAQQQVLSLLLEQDVPPQVLSQLVLDHSVLM